MQEDINTPEVNMLEDINIPADDNMQGNIEQEKINSLKDIISQEAINRQDEITLDYINFIFGQSF